MKLTQRLRETLRTRHYSRRTEVAYVHWVRRFVRFHLLRNPAEMGESEVSAFLTALAVREHVSASTQNQAMGALLFFYRHVLGRRLGSLHGLERAKRPVRLPVVLTPGEVRAVLARLEGTDAVWLVASLLYGSGLRLMEAVTLRVKDVDLERLEVRVRRAKGGKDRVTELPGALERKAPAAARAWAWQWVFPSPRPRRDRVLREPQRHHLHPSLVQRQFAEAVRARTMVYIHVLNRGGLGVRSPADGLPGLGSWPGGGAAEPVAGASGGGTAAAPSGTS